MLHKLLLVDGDAKRRMSIINFLEGGFDHIEPFENVDEVKKHWPREGIFLVNDEQTQIRSVFEGMREIGVWHPLVAYSPEAVPHKIVDSILSGASDYFEWPFDKERFLSRLNHLIASIDEELERRERESEARNRISRLSRRERQVLDCLKNGLSTKEMACELEISNRTVEIHRSNMMSKLGTRRIASVVRMAIEGDEADGPLFD